MDIITHLGSLLGKKNANEIIAQTEGVIDYWPGQTLLMATFNRDLYIFDRDRIIRQLKTKVPPESGGFCRHLNLRSWNDWETGYCSPCISLMSRKPTKPQFKS
jgi:hypothetical protein